MCVCQVQDSATLICGGEPICGGEQGLDPAPATYCLGSGWTLCRPWRGCSSNLRHSGAGQRLGLGHKNDIRKHKRILQPEVVGNFRACCHACVSMSFRLINSPKEAANVSPTTHFSVCSPPTSPWKRWKSPQQPVTKDHSTKTSLTKMLTYTKAFLQ